MFHLLQYVKMIGIRPFGPVTKWLIAPPPGQPLKNGSINVVPKRGMAWKQKLSLDEQEKPNAIWHPWRTLQRLKWSGFFSFSYYVFLRKFKRIQKNEIISKQIQKVYRFDEWPKSMISRG